jgi:phosphoribosylformylglycinamidine cyclo-ligase
VRAVGALLEGGAQVRGLAHITGDGVLNLRRLNAGVGFEIDAPLEVPAICSWLCEAGSIEAAHAYQVFNMGCGFVVVVPEADAAATAELLAGFHPGARVIGHVSAAAGAVTLPPLGVSY